MEIEELQQLAKKVIELIDSKMKGNHDSDTTIIHLYEELGEISRQLYNEKMGREKLDRENLAEEISDCLLLLLHLSKLYDFDIEKEIKNKIEILKQRHKDLDWKKISL